ncbi:hypothetical protein [Nonomuraea longicatena]|uniref:Uncharacterized protein n=1 Tax=Nonomuraea longicatena TaxID=83682 RepID=A0ABN1R7V7_9ACTN
MTDLYAVRVLAVAPAHRRIQLRVTAFNPDVWHWPLPDKSFFLRDLEEDGTVLDLLDDEDDGVDRDFVESVERTATRNYPFTVAAEERLSESGRGFPRESEGPFNQMSPESAAAFLRCEEMRVGADYDVVVTDSRLIAHLKAGDWWRTAAYPGI